MNLDHFYTDIVGSVSEKKGNVSTPIVNSAAFGFGSCEEAINRFSGDITHSQYARLGNPTNQKLEQVMSNIEEGIGAYAVSSGMSAISMAIFSLCQAGDEIVAMGGLFGGTYNLLHNFTSRYGMRCHFIAANDFDSLQQVLNDKTKVIFCESVGNPNLKLTDIDHLASIANEHQIALIVDNTVTPLSIQPLKIGADIVVYSTTKLITGNASALGGMVIFRAVKEDNDKFHTTRYKILDPYLQKFNKEALLRAARAVMRDLGFVGHAMSSYLTLLGMETLPLRLDRLKESIPIIANKLQQAGFNVRHPSLPQHEHHSIYNDFYNGYIGSLLTIDFDNENKAFHFLNNSKLITITANIGDSRTLGLHMASTIYRDYGDEARAFLGVTKGLVRLSIGLEEPKDIINDFIQAIV